MAEIARAAGLSRQAIYLHFEDREALLLALARYADDRRGLDIEVGHVLESSSGVLAMTRYVELLTRTNPGIWVLARAADAVRRTDPAVENTWQNRVQVRLKVCQAIIARIDGGSATSRCGAGNGSGPALDVDFAAQLGRSGSGSGLGTR